MATIGIHEYFRIFVPAMLLVILVKMFVPSQLPGDSTFLILISAALGLLLAPITDRLSKIWFHKQIIKAKFYEIFIDFFAHYHKIAFSDNSKKLLKSFSGSLDVPECTETKCIIEAYKIFARQGWGNKEETYRVRTEKSFGILYFTLFCYLSIVLIFYMSYMIIGKNKLQTISGYSYIDVVILMILMFISFAESTARFRMSLNNELLILEAHQKELKSYYDDLIKVQR